MGGWAAIMALLCGYILGFWVYSFGAFVNGIFLISFSDCSFLVLAGYYILLQ